MPNLTHYSSRSLSFWFLGEVELRLLLNAFPCCFPKPWRCQCSPKPLKTSMCSQITSMRC